MPGSTTADQTKAKVTESSGTNGIFVRPVAVAGIFRPAEESKPPTLPEKRRFSALSGDLRPCSGTSSDDFARRRQSWVKEPKDAPFGQALLRKTPKNTNLPPQTQELASNGSSHKDTTDSDITQLPSVEEKSVESSKSKSELVSFSKTSSSDKGSANEATKLEKTQISLQVNKDEKKLASQSLSKSQNFVSYESSSVTSVQIFSDSATAVTSTHKISVSEKKTSNTFVSSETVDKTSNSVDCSKQKKVYGLIKRDTKSEITPKKAENSVTSENVTAIENTKKEKSFLKKESQSEISSKSENLEQKSVSTLDSSGSKTKVFGLNKLNWKKETVVVKPPETDLVSNPKESTPINRNSNEIPVNKLSETKSSNKSTENSIVKKESASKIIVKALEVDAAKNKVTNELKESTKTYKASDSKAIGNTASDSLSKISDNKTGNKSVEVNVAGKISETKFSLKTPEAKTVNKPLETNSDKIANKLTDSKSSNKFIENAPVVSKVFASKINVKPLEVDKSKIANELNETVKTDKTSDSKATANTASDSLNKISDNKTGNKPVEVNVAGKISENKFSLKSTEAKTINKPLETNCDKNANKLSDSKSTNKSIENALGSKVFASKTNVKPLEVDKSKVANELNETVKTDKTSDSKATVNTASDSLNKISDTKTGNKPVDVNVAGKISENKFSLKSTEVKTVNKPLETNCDKNSNKLSDSKSSHKSSENALGSKVLASKIIVKPLEVDKSNVANEFNEICKTDKTSDPKAVSKTTPNFSNKISGIKTGNKPLDVNSASKTSEIELTPKTSEAKTVIKTLETINTNKSSESKIISNLTEANIEVKTAREKITSKLLGKIGSNNLEAKPDYKTSLTENKVPASADLNKKSETVALSKTPESKDVNKELDNASVSKDVIDSDPSKVAVQSGKISDKVNEFQKAKSPPKDFRTVRRTSDVIAARIQNIFSNISTPEKPPPLLSKKSKVFSKSNANLDSSTVTGAENKTTDSLNPGVPNIDKQTVENSSVDLKKNETQHISEYKSDAVSSSKEVTKKSSLVEKEGIKDEKCSEGDIALERKYNAKTSAADHSGLKKESKLASESSNVSQSCKIAGVTSAPKVKTEAQLGKADSKTELSINAAPSKTLGEKSLSIGGKVPAKKDQKSLEGTASLKATNENDRKSSDSTAPLKTVSEDTHKEPMLKTESSNTCAGSGEKIQKSVFTSYSGNTSSSSSTNLRNNYNVNKKVESGVSAKESNSVKSPPVSTTSVSASTTPAKNSSGVGDTSLPNVGEIKKAAPKLVSSSVETTQFSKIEVAKITPSPVPSPVPTVNVLFRTKSPQSSATKEENRRKVVVETSAGTSPSVINAPQISEKNLPKAASSAPESVQEALKAVESAQKSLNSPRLPSKHSIVNLKKEELAAVTLSTSDMPPNTNDKCASVEDTKTVSDVPESVVRSGKSTPVPPTQTDKTQTLTGDASTESDKTTSNFSGAGAPRPNGVFSASETNIPCRDLFSGDTVVSEARINVVDLDDWTRKFQRPDPSEPPRVPLRRRAQFRESLPPALPVRSRFGSLRRIDDSPRYVPRSPSQSSLPQRYSYTEMLSKVCSMGVLPCSTADPFRSHSSLSSSSQVSELWSELSEEQSNATHTAEMLESETTERMRLEKEVQELQNRYSQVQLRSDKMEMEMMEARVYRSSEINGDLSEDEDAEANSSLYKQKYERAVRDMEIMKRRIQQQHEEEMEQKNMLKKASDKRLAEALEDVEEERQVANQWKRKAQKLGSELQDLRLMLEEQMARNGELEKKQRRFDAELSSAQEEIKKERILREKFSRERDQALHEKYSIEQDLQSAKLDVDTLHEKINQLNRELDELTLSSKGEEEVTQLKRAKQELERKSRDQEEELEELAAQVSMLEQAKLRLEMSLEKVRQEHRREASVREEEIEEIRASFSKKIKNLEAQLETEQDERHQLLKQKHELERRLYEIADQPPPQDPEVERRLRRDLKRTKALLRDAQSMLEHTREGQSGKTLIRQLKNQLEDSEFAKATAVKARQAVEAELHDCQTQLEEATRVKNEVETRCLQLSREKSAIQTQLEEAEEEMAEVMKKYKAVVAQMSIDQKTLTEQNQQIADLETEKQMLKDQLSEVSHKFEHLAGQSEDTHKVHRLDGKVRDLESKLELEQTTRSRLEHQIARLKEQNERAREECESLRNKENQAQEGVRRLQRQMRDLREDYSALQQKEAEAYRKQHELEMALENTETDLQVTKNDLRLACQRIQDLQNALEDDLDSGTDVPDDSGSDSDDSFELSVLRNQSVTPTQRCDSAASNYSLASEGIRSRGSSFSHELSAFSRMMLSRRTTMDFLG